MATRTIVIEDVKTGEVTAAVYDHPLVVRLCHWANAISLFVMVGSGLQIFRAFPSFGAKIAQKDLLHWPRAFALGGWLGGALQWHLTFMWIYLATGLLYIGSRDRDGIGAGGREGKDNDQPARQIADVHVIGPGAVVDRVITARVAADVQKLPDDVAAGILQRQSHRSGGVNVSVGDRERDILVRDKEFGEPVKRPEALAMAPLPANSPQDSPQLALIPPLLEQLFPVSAALAAKKLDVPLPV